MENAAGGVLVGAVSELENWWVESGVADEGEGGVSGGGVEGVEDEVEGRSGREDY